jgi:hypothetical protein
LEGEKIIDAVERIVGQAVPGRSKCAAIAVEIQKNTKVSVRGTMQTVVTAALADGLPPNNREESTFPLLPLSTVTLNPQAFSRFSAARYDSCPPREAA